jgi:hypothetical protein
MYGRNAKHPSDIPGTYRITAVSPDSKRSAAFDRLVALAKDLRRETIPLTAIRELDEPYWSGGCKSLTCRDVAEHARLIQEAELACSIILSSDGRVMDGMHRVAKALIEGVTHIEAVRFRSDPEPDFVGVEPEAVPY